VRQRRRPLGRALGRRREPLHISKRCLIMIVQ
jgi:hypothetical protein